MVYRKSDLNDIAIGLVIDSIQLKVLQRYRTIPLDLGRVRDVVTNQFMKDINDALTKYFVSFKEHDAVCELTADDIIDIWESR